MEVNCKELEEFNDYLTEYLEKSGVNFYFSFLKMKLYQPDRDEVQVINNRIKNSVKKDKKL